MKSFVFIILPGKAARRNDMAAGNQNSIEKVKTASYNPNGLTIQQNSASRPNKRTARIWMFKIDRAN